MTAQPLHPTGRPMWSPDPIRQRLGNYPIEDVFSLPDDAPRVQLRDGVQTFENRLRVRDIAP